MRTSLLVTFLAILALPLNSCGGAPAPSPTATVKPAISAAAPPTAATDLAAKAATAIPTVPISSGQQKELTVFAASSLTESLTELAAGFSAKAGGAKVTYNFGGSNQLRTQIEQGASADVFASANEKEMDTLVKAGLIEGTPSIFTKNRLVVITPKGNPGKIEKLQDLGREGLKIVAAGPDVPVGSYMLQMLDKMNADPAYGAGFKEKFMKNVISQETNVKQVVAKVQLGEGDAGVVYGTDVTATVAPEVQMIEVPDAFNVIAQYPIAPIKDAKEKELAQSFVQYILSEDGQQVMKRYNFAPAK